MFLLSDWFWPIVAGVLAVLWLWTLIRCQPKRSKTEPAQSRRVLERREAEDLLKVVYTLEAQIGDVSVEALARNLHLSEAAVSEQLDALSDLGWIIKEAEGGLRLMAEGRQRARDLIRAHRLWERYLVDREGMALDVVHAEAHHREHEATPQEIARLDAELEHPAWDPHGHVIPAPGSRLPATDARSLLEEGKSGSRLRITQLEEEPSALLAQLVALGLKPGVEIEILERESNLMQVALHGNTVPLANPAARRIHVVPVPALSVPLGELPIGSRARVVDIKGSGKHQRRLLDLGFVPGAEISVVRQAPLGDPVEYRVKETAVALRKEDAGTVSVEELHSD
ncbi:MAG: metal-dependent transcriptional regulator [Anaerolineae bacterium]|nr:metal-dependent transcriptional regulator [Anaerolineae bacterium]